MTLIVPLILLSAACSSSPKQPGIPVAVPQFMPLDSADLARMNLPGAGCVWRAGQDAPPMLVLKRMRGAVKIDGRDMVLSPDPSTPVLPEGAYDVRSAYRSMTMAIEIRRAEGDWIATGPETREAPAELTVMTGDGGKALRPGILSCGA